MQPTQEPQPSPPTDPAHDDDVRSRPNPGDPGPEAPPPRRDDPLRDPRLPVDPPPARGV